MSLDASDIRVIQDQVPNITVGFRNADYIVDGNANVAINAAIAALPTTGGRIIILEGTYNISAPILITRSNTMVEGVGNATVLKAKVSLNDDVILLSPGASGNIQNCVISDMLIDGRSASNSSGNGINTLGSILCYFDHLTIQNVKNVAIKLRGTGSQDSYWNHITECLIQNSGQWVVEDHSHENYIYSCDMNNHGSAQKAIVFNGGGERMTGCTVGAFSATGSLEIVEVSGTVGGASIFNNFFEGSQREHIKVTAPNNLIISNKFVDASVAGAATYAGVSVASVKNIVQQNVFTNPDTTVPNDIVEITGAGNNIISSNVCSTGITELGVGSIVKDNMLPPNPNRWTVQGVGLMHLSKDTMRGQISDGNITTICNNIASMGVTHIGMECPLDEYNLYDGTDPVAGYPEKWIAAIRAAGCKVYFRGTWNKFEGNYDSARSTPTGVGPTPLGAAATVISGADTTSYLYLTYNFIKTHATFFATGDVWAPMPEPENQGIGPATTQMFTSYDVLGQWLVDLKTTADAAFADISKTGIITGMTSINGGTAITNLNTAKYWSQIGRVCIDHYVPISQYGNDLDRIHNNTGVDVYIGEVGMTQGMGGNPSTDSARATQLTNLYTIFSSKPYLKGIHYFQAVGGNNPSSEDIMNYSTYALLPLSAAAIAAFY